ncbi:cytochrome oxidase assembly protein ShyY1 [Nonomuraea soli]|uniref:Cytochrome oxidase assembly protein ShyY1 n=1 Tax=Nonomuraea soli TaxID=1032476 RepID=A0A7W0CHN1_9ACTN|nr:cytochrome oxidase assembly protein ShyY1 [Nonomuraea soli]
MEEQRPNGGKTLAIILLAMLVILAVITVLAVWATSRG